MIIGIKRTIRSNLHPSTDAAYSFEPLKLPPGLNMRVSPDDHATSHSGLHNRVAMQMHAVTEHYRPAIMRLVDYGSFANENVLAATQIAVKDTGIRGHKSAFV